MVCYRAIREEKNWPRGTTDEARSAWPIAGEEEEAWSGWRQRVPADVQAIGRRSWRAMEGRRNVSSAPGCSGARALGRWGVGASFGGLCCRGLAVAGVARRVAGSRSGR